MNIFLSHSRDTAVLAEQLAQRLSEAGADVWLDRQRITPGSRFASEIEKGITQADAAVFLLSPEAERSNFMQAEVALAVAEEASDPNKVVIPVRAARTRSIPPLLQQYSWIDATNLDVQALADSILHATQARRGTDKERERELARRSLDASLRQLRSAQAREERSFLSWARSSKVLERAFLLVTLVASVAVSILTNLLSDDINFRTVWIWPILVALLVITSVITIYVERASRRRARENGDQR